MKRRLIAQAAFQIALFLVIVTIGWGIAAALGAAGVIGTRLIGSAVIAVLTITILLKWDRIFEYFWPRPKE